MYCKAIYQLCKIAQLLTARKGVDRYSTRCAPGIIRSMLHRTHGHTCVLAALRMWRSLWPMRLWQTWILFAFQWHVPSYWKWGYNVESPLRKWIFQIAIAISHTSQGFCIFTREKICPDVGLQRAFKLFQSVFSLLGTVWMKPHNSTQRIALK